MSFGLADGRSPRGRTAGLPQRRAGLRRHSGRFRLRSRRRSCLESNGPPLLVGVGALLEADDGGDGGGFRLRRVVGERGGEREARSSGGGGVRTGAWLSDREVDAVIFRLSGRLVGLLFGRARAACGREARFWPRNRVLARNSGLVDRKGKSLEAKGQVSKIVTVELLPRRARTRFRGQKWRVFLHGRGLRWLLRSGRPHQWLRTARRRAFRTWRIRARGGGLTSLRHSVIKRRDWVARAGKGCRIDSRVEGVSRCA